MSLLLVKLQYLLIVYESKYRARAGAHWRTHAKEGDGRQQAWDLETYEAWMKIVEEEKRRHAQGALMEEDRSGIDVSASSMLCYHRAI